MIQSLMKNKFILLIIVIFSIPIFSFGQERIIGLGTNAVIKTNKER